MTTSTASSPILRQTAASPFASRPATYEPAGAAAFREATIRSMRASMLPAAPSPVSAVKKHVRLPVWQATPSWCTCTSSVSASQSAYTPWTCWLWPDVSPFRHGAWRDRDQKCVRPLSSVRATAARSIQATISTSPVSASCTIAGMRPRSS